MYMYRHTYWVHSTSLQKLCVRVCVCAVAADAAGAGAVALAAATATVAVDPFDFPWRCYEVMLLSISFVCHTLSHSTSIAAAV